jgi:hypothetical protein
VNSEKSRSRGPDRAAQPVGAAFPHGLLDICKEHAHSPALPVHVSNDEERDREHTDVLVQALHALGDREQLPVTVTVVRHEPHSALIGM